jgi:hypothetical protein
MFYHRERNPRLIGRARPRREHNLCRCELLDGLNTNGVVAMDDDLCAKLAKILNEVVGKRIVVIDH